MNFRNKYNLVKQNKHYALNIQIHKVSGQREELVKWWTPISLKKSNPKDNSFSYKNC